VDRGLATVTGFEPNPEEYALLKPSEGRRYLPYAVGDGTAQVLHITRSAGFTSTLVPDPEGTSHLRRFRRMTQVRDTVPIETRRLDDIAEIRRLDYLKIDIQGGECAVFGGAGRLLRSALCVHTEVAFNPIYRDHPLFGAQDAMLREHGLVFFGLHETHRWPIDHPRGMLSRKASGLDIGLWVDADAVFVRDPLAWPDMDTSMLLRLLVILCGVYFAPSASLGLARILEARLSTPGLCRDLATFLNARAEEIG
jgi:FkbM family methyltransferase